MPPRKRQLEESDDEPQYVKKPKGDKAKAGLTKGADADGNAYWDIGNHRRVGTSEFKGKTLVNIREYYTTADGELRPGKKGISLSLEQYKNLLQIIPKLNAELGIDGTAAQAAKGEEIDEAPAKGRAKKDKKSSERANIDVTSDEDEED
ncbi:transcriptional Coactivator p15-domain-containing protein [Bombardia bombarda]|uniref:Transcriptional Coactivator p15-domain-containing protein n=1 Tax=Bombardia bombarda TaxID=252184 RepID=A0AA40BW50_9PEZI|nr:transcriptional Coactivator p15-domain-containing protein [Bombardia bombarda]